MSGNNAQKHLCAILMYVKCWVKKRTSFSYYFLIFILTFSSLWLHKESIAQETIGNSVNGASLWNDKGCLGCHSTGSPNFQPQGNRFNAANAGGYIAYAISSPATGMGGVSVTSDERADIAAYIALFVPSTNPENQAVPYNSAGTAFPIPNLFLGTGYTSIQTVSNPSKGTVIFSGTTATYTPIANQSGSDSFTYRATGPAGTSNIRTATVVIANPPPPVITVATPPAGEVGVAYAGYQVVATNSPSFSATTLPPGLSISASGYISGTPTASGSSNANITATNAGGSDQESFSFTIHPPDPVITVATPPAGEVGVAYAGYQVVATNSPSFSATNLPPGLSISASGYISGTPTTASSYGASITATNGGGSDVESFSFTIHPPGPEITGITPNSGTVGVAYSGSISASNSPTFYNATGLPSGLTLNADGTIAGTPSGAAGDYPVTVTARNSGGVDTQDIEVIIITLYPGAPTLGAMTGTVPYNSGGASHTTVPLSGFISGPVAGIEIVSPPATGTAYVAGTTSTNYAAGVTSIDYTPAVGATGSVTLQIRAYAPPGKASGGASSVGTVTISITNPGAPTLGTLVGTVAYNAGGAAATEIDLSSAIGDPFSHITIESAPAAGTAAALGAGVKKVNFTPAAGATGSVTFQIRAYAPGTPVGESSVGTVTINITNPAAPTLGTLVGTVAYNAGGAAATEIDLSSAIGDPFSHITIESAPAAGTAAALGAGVKKVNFTPAAGATGSVTFQIRAFAPGTPTGNSRVGTVTINITNPSAPTLGSLTGTVAYNASATEINWSTVIGNPFSHIAIESAPAAGTATALGAGVKKVNFTPAAGATGSVTFQIRAYAPGTPIGNSIVGNATINITNPAAPTLGTMTGTVAYNAGGAAATEIDLSSAIGDPFSHITIESAPAAGTATALGAGVKKVNFTPGVGATGSVTFQIRAFAPGTPTGNSMVGTVTINITNPSAPTLGTMAGTVAYNAGSASPTTIDLSGFITGPISGIAIESVSGAGTATVSGATSINYTPAAGAVDNVTLQIRAYAPPGAPTGNSSVGSLEIAIQPLAAGAGTATMTVPLNTATTLDLAPFITGSGISGVSVSKQPAHGTVVVNGTKVTYTPANNYFGGDSFSYRAFGNASSEASPPGAVTVTVIGRPDPTKDAVVTAMISSQVAAARRFSQAQVSNFQTRMESLHRSRTTSSTSAPRSSTAGFASANSSADISAQARSHLNHHGARSSAPTPSAQPIGAAYKPAASLSSNPAGTSVQPAVASAGDALSTVISAFSAGSENVQASEAVAMVGKALGFAANALEDKSFNLSASTDGLNGNQSLPEGTNVWIGGGVRFGTRDKDSSDRIKFSTDGVSIGVDRRFSDDLALGIGVGYAVDESSIGTNGSNSQSKGFTVAAYGSYQPLENVYLDGMLGYGQLKYETERYIEPLDTFAESRRSGDYLFGSLTAAYEHRANGLLLSPYGRLDLVEHRLDAATETGGEQFALHYYRQKIPGVSFAAGLRAETAHETSFGWATPRLRVEIRHDFKGEQEAAISYADQINGTTYTIEPKESKRDSIVLGIGTDLIYRDGLTLSFDYQTERVPGEDIIQAVSFKLTKNLDGRNSAPGLIATSLLGRDALGIKVDAGYLFDSNVSRSSLVEERLSDRSASLNFSKTKLIPLGETTRMFVHGFAGGEQFKNYSGLSKIYLGGQAEVQYRSSGDFGTPIYSVFLNGTAENFESTLRDGHRYSVGLSLRKAFTDRIDLFGALANNVRYGKSAVFDTKDYSARMNLDFALDSRNAFYLGSEYRRGDIVSSGRPSLANVDIAELLVVDDVFDEEGYTNYRFDGATIMWTLGYSLSLGAKDTLDFSLRRIRSEADLTPDYIGASTSRYTTNQFSILYLTSF